MVHVPLGFVWGTSIWSLEGLCGCINLAFEGVDSRLCSHRSKPSSSTLGVSVNQDSFDSDSVN